LSTINTLRAVIGPDMSMRAVLEGTADKLPMFLLSQRAYMHLAEECGGDEPAILFLLELAEQYNKPVLVNFEKPDGTSQTNAMAPRSWTSERLQGWIAGHHEALEQELGLISGMTAGGRE
jgi:hypothetical protein